MLQKIEAPLHAIHKKGIIVQFVSHSENACLTNPLLSAFSLKNGCVSIFVLGNKHVG